MTRHQILADYKLETTSPLHVGRGHGAAGVQRGMLRDEDGLPYIPGSTIKGRARYAMVRICDWMGLPVYRDAVADVPQLGGRSPNGPNGTPDVPSRVFGHAWSRCTLRFEDARASRPEPILAADEAHRRSMRERAHGLREIRTGAARSRLLGTVSNKRLYRAEVAPPGLVFCGRIGGPLDCVDVKENEKLVDYPMEVLLLWLALHLMVTDGLGGSKSAGNGRLSWAPSGKLMMTVNGAPFEPSDDDAATVLQLLPSLPGARPER